MGLWGSVLIHVIIFSAICHSGHSIKCLQCWSLVDPNCEAGNIEATECEPEDGYCIKYVGKTQPRPVVFRDCNPVPVEKLCSIRIIGGHRIYVCYETCTTDACNAGAADGAPPGLDRGSWGLLTAGILLLRGVL